MRETIKLLFDYYLSDFERVQVPVHQRFLNGDPNGDQSLRFQCA